MSETKIERIKPKYIEREWNEEKQATANKIIKDSNISPLLAYLYAIRGIENASEIDPKGKIESYKNMYGIEKAAIILADAIEKKTKMCIVADYDVDGATACAIGVRGLKMFNADIDFVVPNRFLHGYGLSPSVIDEAILNKSPELIITVDNGIASIEGVSYAKSKGVRVLITDHHLQGDDIPDAECIVNPNQKICQFKNKSLAGCGVMFYVLCALRQEMINRGIYTMKNAPNIFNLIDLVAVGTVADVVKLEQNNRVLVQLGLEKIRSGKTKMGIIALIEVANKKLSKTSTMDIGFAIGPRLNAAGRLEDMTIGIKCLLSDNYEEALKLASSLNEINIQRREIEGDMKDFALNIPTLENSLYTKVAFGDMFHEGVVGIVASRLKDIFYRPTIVFAPSMEKGLIKGSGRSISEVNLRDAIDIVYKKNPKLVNKFGGHAMAAGITIPTEALEEFSLQFDKAVQMIVGDRPLNNIKEVDFDLPISEINIDNANCLVDGIWGQGFPAPLFFGDFKIIEQKLLQGKHLKLLLDKDGEEIDAIWFSQDKLLENENVKLVYNLSINEFRGRVVVQLLIDGIKET